MALADVATARGRLDAAERRIIEAARANGATWAEIATVLGLTSRQAAEQRWRRLCQRTIDAGVLDELRLAVRAAARLLPPASPDHRLNLAAATLRAARDAPAGALYALAAQAIRDVEPLLAEPGRGGLEPGPAAALDALSATLAAARP